MPIVKYAANKLFGFISPKQSKAKCGFLLTPFTPEKLSLRNLSNV